METLEPSVIDDYDSWPGRIRSVPRGRIKAIVSVPLMSADTAIGALGIARDASDERSSPRRRSSGCSDSRSSR